MSWYGGSGSIGVGVRELTWTRTDADKEDTLPKGQDVVVIDTEFKLVRKT